MGTASGPNSTCLPFLFAIEIHRRRHKVFRSVHQPALLQLSHGATGSRTLAPCKHEAHILEISKRSIKWQWHHVLAQMSHSRKHEPSTYGSAHNARQMKPIANHWALVKAIWLGITICTGGAVAGMVHDGCLVHRNPRAGPLGGPPRIAHGATSTE